MITTQKTPVTAPDRGTGRCNILYGSSDRALNLAVTRARQMSPSEMYDAGFRAGFDNKGMRGSLADYPEYVEGWGNGYRSRF